MRKFLIWLFAALIICLPAIPKVSAEQAAAEQYRKMFRSGNFYVEYQMFHEFGKYVSKTNVFALAGKNGKRMQRTVSGSRFAYVYTDYFDSTNLYNLYSAGKISDITNDGLVNVHENIGNGRFSGILSLKKKTTYPNFLYQNGKYYIFIKDPNKSSSIAAKVLAEENLNSPTLNPVEGWDSVRDKLSLPDELAVFCWNEPFRDNPFNLPQPIYNNSSKLIVDNQEYDCDQYVFDIKDIGGNIIAQEVYNMLYLNGKLVMIQKNLIRDGKEYSVRKTQIKEITSTVPDEIFTVAGKKVNIYAAENGDINDLTEQPVLVETWGGK